VAALFWQLEIWRTQPFAHVRASFSPSGAADKSLAFYAVRSPPSFLAELRSLVGKAGFKRLGFSEMASLHGTAPSQGKAGAQPAFSSPIEADGRAVML
jgi:hypothetical protein